MRVKGNEAPLRFELLNERLSLHIDVCYDDATFTKNTVHSIHSQEDKLMLHFNKNTEWAYIRVVYESQDLAGILLVFRAYFGKQQQLLQASGSNMPTPPPATSLHFGNPEDIMDMKDVVNKTQNDKIKRMQMMARIKYIIGDEIKSKQMI